MERGQFILALAGGRARPSLRLAVPIRTITATIVGEPALCAHPDLPEPASIQELCRALVRRGAPEAALQLVWPDRRPAMFVPSIRECAAHTDMPPPDAGEADAFGEKSSGEAA